MSSEEEMLADACEYLYRNPITAWIHDSGHKKAEQLRKKKNVLILDCGCGNGDHLRFVQSKTVGIDKNDKMLEIAQNANPTITFLQGDITKIPFRDNSFDSIVSMYVLEHIDALQEAINEISRILKRNGEFIVGLPTEGFSFRIGRKLTTKRYMEKRYLIDYEKLVEEEHVNDYKSVLKELEMRFKITNKKWLPFYIPSLNLNIIVLLRCVK